MKWTAMIISIAFPNNMQFSYNNFLSIFFNLGISYT